MFRRALAAVFAGLATACTAEPEPARVNLLLVVLDTTRADHLSCYGYGKPTTPAIDALARAGVRFDQVFAQSSLTPVSVGTLLSGAYPFRHGVRSLFVVERERLSPAVASLPEMLAASGRRTAAFVSAQPMGGKKYGLARGFETYEDDVKASMARLGVERPSDAAQRPADETVPLALAWLDAHGREPFALMIHLFDAHDASIVPPREFLAQRVSFELPRRLSRGGGESQLPALADHAARVELYDAELAFMDEWIARVIEKLDQLGVRERTLIAVVADHGEAFGEHGFWTHGILYEHQLRVPLILAGPDLPAGAVVGERGRLVDFLPTIAELLDLPRAGAALDGRSLADRIAGARGEPLDVYAEVRHAPDDPRGRDAEMYSLRVKGWKYIHRPATGKHELYDLEADARELVNLYTPEHPMARALAHRIGAMGALGGTMPSLEGIPEDELARLRQLGYLK
jgi:arylsulfatase A-like enzyme